MDFFPGDTKQQQLEWRRSQVLSLSSEGYNQREIASKLQVNVIAVNRDVQFLKRQAKENLEKHIHETIPFEYQKAMDSLNKLLRMGWNIVNTTADEKIRLQAGALINECTRHRIDLSNNGVVITEAIKYVNGKMEHLNKKEKKLLQDIKEDAEAAETEDTEEVNSSPRLEEQQTHNGVF
jgi:hypothetical protein